jgi:hypothetical protein
LEYLRQPNHLIRLHTCETSMPLLTYGSLAESNSSMFTGPASILSTKGTDVIALEQDGRIFAYDPGDIAWVLICAAMAW